ncbi:MAG: Cys-tRNA(Pro) deacylase [Bacilli bacterium]|nr:Cys-tRNA(Pro) deacylase [Bacilli bacterium]MDD7314105.1 Cys-tRNA(Pro) deacylase [Bacilli bacterium]MDY4051951.1 Cys-tRNA(Pro) deacylase [Bacilli bacterium]
MKNQIEKTNAIRIIEQKKLNYQFHDYVGTNAISGEDVAKVLNQDPNHVFKTLVTIGKSNNHYVFLVPVNMELDLKKAAIAVNEKNIEMIKSKDLLPLTGYIHGGCSPIGMKKQFTTIIDESAILYDTIMFSGGKIGYQVEMSIDELSKVVEFKLADITKNR